ncbi:MAG: PilZ domain-containing protein [Phycisphaeraceae bacterium]|nr:MAG: PilZ domain-containing protein [Phycisphaeraceae bacterium]
MNATNERRREPRTPVRRPCKVFHRGTWRYLPGTTADASEHGLLIEAAGGEPPIVGDIVDVAVGWENQPILRTDEFIHGRVVRVGRGAGGSSYAVELTRPTEPASR